MKLINFKDFQPFKDLRKLMNIKDEDRISINNDMSFKVDEIFWKKVQETGVSIPKEKIIKHSDFTLGIKGSEQRIIIYIKEQYFNPNEKEKEYKFHISWCKTLEDMYKGNRYNRYIAVQKEEPNFLVDLINLKNKRDVRKDVEKRLNVCKHCLIKLNYKGYATASPYEKKLIYENFSLKEFLKEYNKTEILVIPRNVYNEEANVYTDDWHSISLRYREFKNWKCEKCGKNCINDKKDLHTHHIDGNKRNNSFGNLMALCSECHSNMPYHEHMKK